MIVYKCKMCGANLNIEEGASICTCEYCDTTQTVPKADDEKKVSLFSRANRLRINNEFDKAESVYESIVAEFPEEAEAYWGLVLCKYGIEYVDDPATGKKIPTCHRSSFDSVMDDTNFEQACENADANARPIYRAEAKQIEELRKGIIEVSSKEAPYDIFICYKETDENGDRTIDSVIAQDVYDELTKKGYRVFFSRISLEDKLGQEYEPYIFAALNSAKVMLAFGTNYEYYNAVWVKNEWSRFIKLMAKDGKKYLIPCFKDIDAYDMPKEFTKLQAQDMGKIGAIQDLLRGIEKILPKNNKAAVSEGFVSAEKQKRLGGPDLIKSVKLVGVNDPEEYSKDAPMKTTFDRSEITYIYVRMVLKEDIDLPYIPLGFNIYDRIGNKVFSYSKDREHKPGIKGFRTKWKIKNDDGTYLYETGDYHLEAWACDSKVYEFNFKITDPSGSADAASDPRSEKEKRMNGPKLISSMKLVGADNADDVWPTNPAMNSFKTSDYGYIAVQFVLGETINAPKVTYGFDVYDDMGNKVFSFKSDLDFKPEYTMLCKVWEVKEGDSFKYDVGIYHIEAWVQNSQIFEYAFRFYDPDRDDDKPASQHQRKELNANGTAIVKEIMNPRVLRMTRRSHRNTNGKDRIAFLQFVCTNREDDYFPIRNSTRRVDLARFSYLSMQIILTDPIGVFTTLHYNYTVYDCYNNEVLNQTMEVDVEPGFDKFSLMLILKQNGVVKLSPGEYSVDAWVADSRICTERFTVFDSSKPVDPAESYRTDIPDDVSDAERREILKGLVARHQYLLYTRSHMKNSILEAGKILKLEKEISAVDMRIGILSEVDDYI